MIAKGPCEKSLARHKESDAALTLINGLFKKAAAEWPGIFKDGEDIELTKRQLQVCIGPIEGVRFGLDDSISSAM